MLPLMLDLSRLKLILIGEGEAALRRLALLDDAGASALTVHAETPSAALVAAAGRRLVRRLPDAAELAAARLVFLSERDAPYCSALAAAARAAGALVHVEDAPMLGDVQAPAVMRRGDLTIAVSTGGKSPGLAALVKRFLAQRFGAEWQERLDALAARRRGWRASGADARTIARWSEAWVARQGWLPAETTASAAVTRPRLVAGQ
jgi:precorrin-2 dehydrogenase / sirohydrochlorin ferrochelatase